MDRHLTTPNFLHLQPDSTGLEYLEVTLVTKQDVRSPNKLLSLLATTVRDPKYGPSISTWELILRTTNIKRGKHTDYPVELSFHNTEIDVSVQYLTRADTSLKDSLDSTALALAEERWRTLLLLDLRSQIKNSRSYLSGVASIHAKNAYRALAFNRVKLEAAASLPREGIEIAFDLIQTLMASKADPLTLNIQEILQVARSALLH